MKIKKEHLLLYAVTDRTWTGKMTLEEQVEEALKGGVTMVQLREKNLSETDFLREAVRVRELCHKYRVPFIINDNVRVALECGADGVHVGIEDTPVSEIRELAGEDFIIGATAKTVEQAMAAEAAGADYLGVGAVFPSVAKKEAVRITVKELRDICSAVSVPVVAIGGIALSNIAELKGGGMNGVAVVSAIFGAENIAAATAQLKEKVRSVVESRREG